MHTFYENPPIEDFDDFVSSIGDNITLIREAAKGLPMYGKRADRMLTKLIACGFGNSLLTRDEQNCLKQYLNLVPSVWGIDCSVSIGLNKIQVKLEGNGYLYLTIGSYYCARFDFHDKEGFGEGGLNLDVTYNTMLGEMLDKIREIV